MEETITHSMSGKADIGKRFAASLIDSILTSVAIKILDFIPFIGPLLGAVVGIAYMLFRDGMSYEFMDHRSVGKKLMKLRPVTLEGKPIDIETSIKRNWMFGIGQLAVVAIYIPILGWLLLPVIGLAALVFVIMECVLVVKNPEGRRWGDKFAGTKVIEVND